MPVDSTPNWPSFHPRVFTSAIIQAERYMGVMNVGARKVMHDSKVLWTEGSDATLTPNAITRSLEQTLQILNVGKVGAVIPTFLTDFDVSTTQRTLLQGAQSECSYISYSSRCRPRIQQRKIRPSRSMQFSVRGSGRMVGARRGRRLRQTQPLQGPV